MQAKRQKQKGRKQRDRQVLDITDLTVDRKKREKKIVLFLCLVLFLFGAYQSVIFYGHQIVPNSDFPGFYHAGKAILSCKLPGSFKRAPVTGILQNLLTPLMSENYPDLKAGWLLNAILHPFNGILLFLLAKELIGQSAKWFALICLINPWVLYLLLEPIAETTLLFFILLTTCFIFRKSKWCYLFAAISTMVRYECAALILAAFVIDMILGKSRKERFISLGLSALASVPLCLWMLATLLNEGSDSTHYFNVFKASSSSAFSKLDKDKIGIFKHLGIIWAVGYKNLFSLRLEAAQNAAKLLMVTSQIIAGVTFFLGAVMAVFKKNWKILVLGIFLVPYVLIHAYYPYPIPRFHMPSFWIALLISIYGINEVLKTAAQNRYVAKVLVVLQLVMTIIFLLWFFSIIPNLRKCGQVCPKAIAMPWVAIIVLILLGCVPLYLSKYKGFLKEICVFSILLVIIVSNQLPVAWLLNTGSKDAEFKELADWYMKNAKDEEGLATTLSGVVELYLPWELKKRIVNYRNIKGENLLDFAQKLEKKKVVYVAWDSRLGLAPQDPYYDLFHLENIRSLVYPKNQGPYKFIKQIQNGQRFINIFKLEDVNEYRLNTPSVQPANKAAEPTQ